MAIACAVARIASVIGRLDSVDVGGAIADQQIQTVVHRQNGIANQHWS